MRALAEVAAIVDRVSSQQKSRSLVLLLSAATCIGLALPSLARGTSASRLLDRAHALVGARVEVLRYPSGAVAEERHYVRGERDGVHRGWYENGTPRFEYHYRHDLLDGVSREWMESGAIYREQHYVRGHEAGLQRLWWPDGRIRASYVMEDGRRFGLMGAKGCVTTDSTAPRRIAGNSSASLADASSPSAQEQR